VAQKTTSRTDDMSDNPSRKPWVPRLVIVGLIAIGAAWGLNQIAIWRLERQAPEPADPTASVVKAPPEVSDPVVSPGFVIEKTVPQKLAVDKDVDELDVPSDDRPSTGKAASSSKPAPSKPAPSKPVPSKPSPSAAPKPTRSVFAVDIKRLQRQFKRPEDAAGHGHILPHYQNGERRGLKFAGVAPGGLFGRLGIESGDVILSVNGTKITTQQKAFADFENLSERRTFNVVLERGGKPRHHQYVLK
jgi:hypothetical protein